MYILLLLFSFYPISLPSRLKTDPNCPNFLLDSPLVSRVSTSSNGSGDRRPTSPAPSGRSTGGITFPVLFLERSEILCGKDIRRRRRRRGGRLYNYIYINIIRFHFAGSYISPGSFKMEGKHYSGRQEAYFQERQIDREEAYSNSLIEDSGKDFHLPIDHRPTENLDTENLEQASLDTQLTSSNVGFRLLQKMGWKGKGLGKNEQGIIEPIKTGIRDSKLGVGKQEQDDFFTAEENVQRRRLDIELEETEELVRKREVLAEREQKIQTEVKEIKKVFFCDLCNKQYKLAMEFESHLSSYDHNHRKRFKEMKEMHGSSSRDERQKREQLRQEKEMARFAQMADAHKQQQQQQQEQLEVSADTGAPKSASKLLAPDQRQTLKFGFSRPGVSKTSTGIGKKPKIAVSSIFGNDSDDES
ncbi:G patch domain-containing protein 8 isoform X2 [Phoenix dactylifera]|uniref:G patch domain-containing protein 8 isoform X2 n=1 Tax=Phoenix dactylifera TaxID=42345 RepID=A0A8B9ADQ7_PHODC|nr:G patch domain-containing protein 8 isoform X2 [Phoenix dactylifera]